MTAWTKTTPLVTGLHPPEQCARGLGDCRSLAQIISSGEPRTFICCGELAPSAATPDPRDRWSFCVHADQTRECLGTDLRIFVDEMDIVHASAVLGTAGAVIRTGEIVALAEAATGAERQPLEDRAADAAASVGRPNGEEEAQRAEAATGAPATGARASTAEQSSDRGANGEQKS